jgi:predicted transcriptional regulator
MAATATRLASPPTWLKLASHLSEWFYRPDLEALEVCLSAVAAHHNVQGDPVWLFVIGPSSSGKTSIIINSLAASPSAYVLGDLTRNTFISHQQGKQGGGDSGLLKLMGKSGIFLFKDFTTFLSKREEERAEIAAQLREIYDGRWTKNTGAGATDWEGKVTTIAVATPILERAWGVKRELGERFLTVRWPRIGGIAMARAAAKQRGRETSISDTTRALGKELLSSMPSKVLEPIPDEMSIITAALSELIAHVRANVTRDSSRDREIIDLPNIEEPGRINKSLELLVAGHAALWHRSPSLDDLRIAQRVAFDTMPPVRRVILDCFRSGAKLTRAEIAKATGVPSSTVHWTAEELESFGLLTIAHNSQAETEYTLTEKAQDLFRDARL